VVRGETDHSLVSRASALGWDAAAALRVVVGSPASGPREGPGALRREAGRAGRSVLVGVQGSRQVVLVSEPGLPEVVFPERLAMGFGPGPVVIGPVAPDLAGAHASARDALSGLRAATAWPAPGSSRPSRRWRRPPSCGARWRSTWRAAAPSRRAPARSSCTPTPC